MNDFQKFTSPNPLKIKILDNTDPVWFQHSESVVDIASWALDNVPGFVEERLQDRIYEIYDLIKEHSIKENRPFDYMMCSRELGLPGDIIYMECAPHLMIDPTFDLEASDQLEQKFYQKTVLVPYGDKPTILSYSVPDHAIIKYMDIDFTEHQIEICGETVFRFLMCFEYLSGFVIYRDLLEREAKRKAEETPKKRSWFSFTKAA